MLIWEFAITAVVVGFFVAMVLSFVFKEGLVEVDPYQAVVVKNIWTGVARGLTAGTHQIIAGWEEKLGVATLKNEPSDPPVVNVITKDAVEIGVDYVIHTQKVVDAVNAVKAITAIKYEDRSSLIQTRIRGYLQGKTKDYSAEDDLIEVVAMVDQNGKRVEKRRPNMTLIGDIQQAVNTALSEVETEWGIKVDIRIQNLILPQKLMEVAEEAATAQREGQRIKDKADAANVSPWLMTIGDIVADVVKVVKGGGK